MNLEADFSDEGPLGLEALVEGGEHATPFGPCFVARRSYSLEHYHGRLPLASFLSLPADLPARLGTDLLGIALSRTLFLDVETTGLGVGSLVFLVGIGRFDGDFCLEQFLMRHPKEEPALLYAVGERLARGGGLVTFNGRAFDWPLLMRCYDRQGLWPDRLELPHLDLLPLARQRWRRRLPSCSLASLEYCVLGIEREDDLPSHLIPGTYLRYLSEGNGRLLQGVLEHNAQDILSMVVLAAHMARVP